MDKFRFVNDGNKVLKKQNRAIRSYYKCTEEGCKARYSVTKTSSGETLTTYRPPPHNHSPPEKPRTRKAIKQQALGCFDVGVTPSVAHKQFVNTAPLPLSPADVPSLGQLKAWKHRNIMDRMPSGIPPPPSIYASLILCLYSYVSALWCPPIPASLFLVFSYFHIHAPCLHLKFCITKLVN